MTAVVVEAVSPRPTSAAPDVRPVTRPCREQAALEGSARWWLWAVAWGALDGPAGAGIALALL